MDPVTIIAMIQAASAIAGPVLHTVLTEAETVGADVSAHRSALQTFEDALAALSATFANPPAPQTK